MPDFLETTVDKFIFRVATDRLYSPAGIWVLAEEGRLRLGVTDYQQQLNGDVAFVHLKPAGSELALNGEFAEVETIKATVSFGSPVSGKIAVINGDLELTPELVNQDPYGKGWLAVIDPADWSTEQSQLHNAAEYLSLMQSQAEEELKKS
jgi:glycine cleavage system H protein